MDYSVKAKISAVIGVVLIVFVASLLALPFMNSDSNIQPSHQESIKKLESTEERMLDFIAQEKTEFESKIGGKIRLP